MILNTCTLFQDNRFTDDPPLVAENINEVPSKTHSKLSILVFNSEKLTTKDWANLEKNLVDSVKDTKLIESINCQKYYITGNASCSFVFAANSNIFSVYRKNY
jgi:hypothetical protein